jgi:L-lactate dehydrogenase (cytochrome)
MSGTYNVSPASTIDFRRLAEKRLPRFLFDYIDGGANDELTLINNVSDFKKILIKQKVLSDVSNVDTSTTLIGESSAFPLALAPIGLAGMMARRGEVQAVRAANKANIPFTLSTVGICSLKEVRANAQQPFWFQLYMLKDRGAVKSLLDDALKVGCSTLIFTVDMPLAGMRRRDVRNGMSSKSLKSKFYKAMQLATRPSWLLDVGMKGRPLDFGNLVDKVSESIDLNEFAKWINSQFNPATTWKDIEWLRGVWPGKIILKGLLELDDALEAVKTGVDGLIVSNHGGRQLDSVASTISKLSPMTEAVNDQLEVYIDGGIRSGLDLFKVLALGAKGGFIGRPWIWALAGAGQNGLCDLINIFKLELEIAMSLSGVTKISQIHKGHVEFVKN